MLCKHCNTNPVQTKANGKSSEFCSLSCRSKFYSKQTIQKREQTLMQKHGVTNVFLLAETQEKIKQTNIKKYNTEHPAQCDSVKEKIKAAWQKYNNGHPFSDPDIRAKREETLKSKFGVCHPILNEEIREKIKQTNIARYGHSNAAKSDVIKSKISSTHNSPEFKEKVETTNLQKYGVKHHNQIHIKQQLNYLTDYELLNGYIQNLGIVGTAVLLDVSVDTVRKHVKQLNISVPLKSSFESQVLDFIKTNCNYEIISNYRIGNKELDIFIPELKLAIECNGSYWHSELNGKGRDYHKSKTELCAKNQIHLIHVWEHNWNQQTDLMKSRILSFLGKNKKLYARKCVVKEITSNKASSFLNSNHIQGNVASSVKLGLFTRDSDELVAVMTFGKSRFTKTAEYELLRFANVKYTNVVGAASKLLSHFIATHNPKSIVSYSDKSINRGKLYEVLGFKFLHSSPPAYFYTKDYKVFENRIKYQKHKLKNLLPEYDENLSEWDLLRLNGYDRIWDCGNDVWVLLV